MAAQMNKKLIAGGLVLVVAALGWVWAGHQATKVAKDQIDGFLIRNGLAGDIRYQDLSASPFGTATLKGVSVMAASANPILLGKVQISDVELKGEQLRGISLSADTVEIPLLAFARQQRNLNDTLRDAIGLGYDAVRGEASLAVRYDDVRGTVSLQTSGSLNDAGGWKAKVVLGGISTNTVNELYTLAANARQLGGLALFGLLGQAGDALARTALVEMDLGVDNGGWFKRAAQVPDTGVPVAAVSSSGVDETQLVKAGMGPSDAHALRQKLDTWVSKGGALRVTSSLSQPLPLFRGSILQPNFDGLAGFVVAARLNVTN